MYVAQGKFKKPIFTVVNMERYRSGHNEAVLKTVCPKGRVGSNPTLSVLGEVPKLAEGAPLERE
jgi:hypothetical protein